MNARASFEPVEIDATQAMLEAVDRRGREMDEKWGTGRLPSLVPVEWAERFGRQKAKMTQAVWSFEPEAVRTHGEAMVRAYAKLDELAFEAGHKPGSPDVWEFMAGEDLVLLCRDIRQVGCVDTGGRKCQVWSLDEVASVIRAHPEIVSAKNHFAGSEVVSIRPVRDAQAAMDRELNDDLPF